MRLKRFKDLVEAGETILLGCHPPAPMADRPGSQRPWSTGIFAGKLLPVPAGVLGLCVPERKESLAGKRGDRLTLPKACWELPSVSAGEVPRVCLQDEALFGGGFQGPQ